MAKGTSDLVVYLERRRISFYAGPFKKIAVLNLEENLVKDLEVIDKTALVDAVSALVNVEGVSANFVIVFADSMTIYKDLPDLTAQELEGEEKSFSSIVPFDRAATKFIKEEQGYRAVAINSEIYRMVAQALVPKGFKLVAVIPAIAIDKFDQKAGLTDKAGSRILSKVKSLKNYSFLPTIATEEKVKSTIQNTKASGGKFKLMPMLIGVFLLLLLVLLGLLLKRR